MAKKKAKKAKKAKKKKEQLTTRSLSEKMGGKKRPTKAARYETIEAPRNDFNPTDFGEWLEGVYVERFVAPASDGMKASTGFRIVDEDGEEWVAWGREDLRAKMNKVALGSMVYIELEEKIGRKYIYLVKARPATEKECRGLTVVEPEEVDF